MPLANKKSRDQRTADECEKYFEASRVSGFDHGWEVETVRKMVKYDGKILVYVQWKNGILTQEHLVNVKTKSPQELIKYYEQIIDFHQ